MIDAGLFYKLGRTSISGMSSGLCEKRYHVISKCHPRVIPLVSYALSRADRCGTVRALYESVLSSKFKGFFSAFERTSQPLPCPVSIVQILLHRSQPSLAPSSSRGSPHSWSAHVTPAVVRVAGRHLVPAIQRWSCLSALVPLSLPRGSFDEAGTEVRGGWPLEAEFKSVPMQERKSAEATVRIRPNSRWSTKIWRPKTNWMTLIGHPTGPGVSDHRCASLSKPWLISSPVRPFYFLSLSTRATVRPRPVSQTGPLPASSVTAKGLQFVHGALSLDPSSS